VNRSRRHRRGLVPCPSSSPAPVDDDWNTTDRSLDHRRDSDVSAAARQTAPHTWHSAVTHTHTTQCCYTDDTVLQELRKTVQLRFAILRQRLKHTHLTQCCVSFSNCFHCNIYSFSSIYKFMSSKTTINQAKSARLFFL